MYKKIDGVLVAEVDQGSPAWRSGLRGGDIITAVNRQAVGSVDVLSSVLERSKSAIAMNIIK